VVETYYSSFYGLRSPPFHVTPDASLFFATDTHQQAMAAIEYGVTAEKGFIVVTGEVGVGKTTVLRAVLDRFDSSKSRVIYLFNPDLSVAELYAAILEGLDAGAKPGEASETLQRVQEALVKFNERGVAVILAVDEAQNMPEETLEHLRVLSNLETMKSKLLQIVLVGQPELDAILRRQSLRQLAQRVAVRAKISRLSFGQSCRYIQHRLTCCGRPIEPPLFSTPALWYLAYRARGIPRSLNIYCDNALINGYGHRAPRLTLRIVREAVKTLQVQSGLSGRGLAWALGALAVAVLTAAFFWNEMQSKAPPPAARIATITAPPAGAGAEGSAPASSASTSGAPATGATAPAAAAVASSPVVAAPEKSEPPEAARASAAANAADGAAASAADSAGARVAPEVAPVEAAPRADASPHADASPPASALPNVAATPAAAAPGAAAATAAGAAETRPHTWVVKRGDSIFKACLVTYGHCDSANLKAIFALNPQIRSHWMLWPGDKLVLPAPSEAAAAN